LALNLNGSKKEGEKRTGERRWKGRWNTVNRKKKKGAREKKKGGVRVLKRGKKNILLCEALQKKNLRKLKGTDNTEGSATKNDTKLKKWGA